MGDKNETVNKRSSQYMFGQIMARLGEGDKVINGLGEKVDQLREDVSELPCLVHRQKIDVLEQWTVRHNKKESRKAEVAINFKHGIIIAVLVVLATCIVSSLMAWLLGG